MTVENAGAGGLVDVHAHFVTPWYVEAATAAGHVSPDGMPGWPTWTPEEHMRLMDDHGIERSVLSISSPGIHFGDDAAATDLARRVNDHAAQVCANHPDRFGFFASVALPDVEAALHETARALDELGAAGIVVETSTHGHYLGDAAYESFFAELSRREAVLFVHPTSPPGWEQTAQGFPRPMLEFLVDTTRSLTGLLMNGTLARHPGVEVVVPHCGAFLPLLTDRLALFAGGLGAGPDPTEMDEVVDRLWFDLAGTPMPSHAETLISRVGTSRLLYGSDYCWTPAPLVAAHVHSLDTRWDSGAHSPWRELVAANAARLWPRGGR